MRTKTAKDISRIGTSIAGPLLGEQDWHFLEDIYGRYIDCATETPFDRMSRDVPGVTWLILARILLAHADLKSADPYLSAAARRWFRDEYAAWCEDLGFVPVQATSCAHAAKSVRS